MNSSIASIDDFDRSLRSEYARFAGDLPGQPESLVQRRFAQYCVFPKLGWALIGVGEAQALATNDAAILYGTLARFVKCAHGCWGSPDEQGQHPGGYDYCSLVVPALYSALLGKSYIASAFCCRRPVSVTGHAAYRHAANLMVCLECMTWTHREGAIARARSVVSSKSKSKVDMAFVGFFLGIVAEDRDRIADALATFAAGYLQSDWGRHKPLTKSTFVQAMIAYAGLYLTDPIDERTHRSLVSSDRIELWQQFDRRRAEFERSPHRFDGTLSFLDDLETR